MFPLLAIGGVIGAVMSIGKGASWLSGQVDSASSGASVGGKGDSKPNAEAKVSAFESTLAAQVAGQSVPVSASALMPTAALPLTHGPDQDVLGRMKAGMLAYNHIGEHRGTHAKPPMGTDDRSVARA
jgi:hypothetical protein